MASSGSSPYVSAARSKQSGRSGDTKNRKNKNRTGSTAGRPPSTTIDLTGSDLGQSLQTIPFLGVRGGIKVNPETGEKQGYVPWGYSVTKQRQTYMPPGLGEADLRRPVGKRQKILGRKKGKKGATEGIRPGQVLSAANMFGASGINTFQEDYQAQPLYIKGDEWGPGGWGDHDKIREMQYKLLQANFYAKGAKIQTGVWNDIDADAMSRAMQGANAQAIDINEFLDQILNDPSSVTATAGGTSGDGQGQVVTITDPDDIKDAVASATQSLFGRNIKLPDDFVNNLVSQYQQMSRERQIAHYNLQDIGTTGEISGESMGIPDPSSYVRQRIEERYPVQSQYDEFADAMNTIIGTLTSSGYSGTR